jgi:sec-independent protein translocase protein TatA
MTPLAFGGLGAPELLIILAVVLLLFGGSRLAGLGKSTGRALKEFKEETKGLRSDQKGDPEISGTTSTTNPYGQQQPPAAGTANGVPHVDPNPVQHPAPSAAPHPTDSDVRRDV